MDYQSLTKRRVLIAVLASLLVVMWGPVTRAQLGSKQDLEKEYYSASMRGVPRDAFPVLHSPPMGTVADGDKILRPNEWVIGVILDGEAKAYPITVMGFHELINDTVGSNPITVCW